MKNNITYHEADKKTKNRIPAWKFLKYENNKMLYLQYDSLNQILFYI